MPENKGIEIVFRGETTAFEAAVKKVNGELKKTKSDISLLNKELKFDPKNVEALTKKFESLRQKEKQLTDLTQVLSDGLAKMDPNDKQWSTFNKQLQTATFELQKIRKELNETSVASVKVQQIGKSFEDFGKNLDGIGGKLETIGAKLSVLSAGVVGLATSGVRFNATLEQYQVAFTTLIGDADKAADAIANIQADAAVTPFSTDALIQANQYLLAAGVEAEDARKTIMALGDAVAATGGGSNELSRMAQNLQQIKNVGKASAQDIKQFANAGINIYGLLADAMGVTTEQAKDMDVSFDVLNDALIKASSEGGKYFGAMENQSQTLNGQLSSLKDNVQQLLGELTAELLPIIKEVLEYVKEFVQRLKQMSPEQKAMVQRIGLIVAALGPAVTLIGNLVRTFGGLSSAIGGFLKSEKIVGIVAKLTANGSSLGAVLKTILGAVKGILGPVAIAIGILAVLYAKNEQVRNAINGLVQALIGALKPAFNVVMDIVQLVIGIFGKYIEIIGQLWNAFKESTAAQILIDALTKIFEWVTKLVEAFGDLFEWIDKGIKWFGELLGITSSVDASIGNISRGARTAGFNPSMMSAGYASSGMMASNYTFNNTFTLNGIGMTRESANRFADMMTDRINENLGRRV